MQKTPQQLAAELEAEIIEFDRATHGLYKPRDELCVDERRTAKLIRLSDYRVLH